MDMAVESFLGRKTAMLRPKAMARASVSRQKSLTETRYTTC